VLSIHGARADYTKSDAVAFGLQERGYSLLGMNMSGHSKAGVLEPEQTTLGNNVREAEAFFDNLDSTRPKVVIGYSLGGTPALKLLEQHADEIDKLILFYPGIYSKDAYDKNFGPEFRDVITQPFSYRNNDTIDLLRSFKGDLLLVKGQYDGLDPIEYGKPAGGSAGEVEVAGTSYYSPIPKEVIDMIYQAMPADRRQLIEVPDCGHSVVLWMRDHPTEANRLLDQLDIFLKN
jgi:pimeloyl-ACP methyl ester carboxylesterase